MSLVTVYSFLVPDIREGTHVPAKGKATRELIEGLHGVVVEQTAEVIDESLLNETGPVPPTRRLINLRCAHRGLTLRSTGWPSAVMLLRAA